MGTITLRTPDSGAGTAELSRYLAQLTREVRAALADIENDRGAEEEQARLSREELERTRTDLAGAVGRLGVLGRHQVIQANEPPENAVTGTIWLDTSGSYPAYRRYDGEAWIPVTDYGKLAGGEERLTAVERAVSEDGIAQLVSRSASVGGAVRSIVGTAFFQGADGMEARMTRVERGIAPVTDWIRFSEYGGESGLMIGTDTSSVWVFITNTALRIMNGSDTAASFSLNRAVMNDAASVSGLTLGRGENAVRIDWSAETGTVLRPN